MGVFFESPRPKQRFRDALTVAYLHAPPATPDAAQQLADSKASELAQAVGVGPLKAKPLLVSIGFLLLVAVGAFLAEVFQVEVATEQLWIAFQTILGVVLGFIGGEVTGKCAL
jgi:hypothetical protein